MKLHTSGTSPFGRKARAMAIEKGVAFEWVDVTPPYSVLAPLNPLGQVPVLELDDGTALFDSAIILEYLDGLAAPSLRGTGERRIRIGVWEALADGMMESTVRRLLEQRRDAACQDAAQITTNEEKLARALAYVEARVGDGFLVDGELSTADIAIACALGYLDLRYPHDWRSRHPRLAAYDARMAARPSLATTRPPT